MKSSATYAPGGEVPTIEQMAGSLLGDDAKRAILAMIDALAAFKMAPSYRDVARATGLAKSSVQHHVSELREAGILEPTAPLRRRQPPQD